MPAGIAVTVVDGFATVDFLDPSLKPGALSRLLDIGGPASIELDTRSGPRRLYTVPEGNARAAGLLDLPSTPEPAETLSPDILEPETTPLEPETKPLEWLTRAELNARARELGVSTQGSKADVIAAIIESVGRPDPQLEAEESGSNVRTGFVRDELD